MDSRRRDRRQNDQCDDVLEVLTRVRNQASEEEPEPGHTHGPYHGTDNRVHHETRIVHAGHARDDRGKRAHNWHEPSDDQGLTAMPFVELVCTHEVALVEPHRVVTIEQARSHPGAVPVTDQWSDGRGKSAQQAQRPDLY